jgi:hypothetical protein
MLVRRSTVQSLTLQLAFPGTDYNALAQIHELKSFILKDQEARGHLSIYLEEEQSLGKK